jgi:hypothetical protein
MGMILIFGIAELMYKIQKMTFVEAIPCGCPASIKGTHKGHPYKKSYP